jgi:hypothetical protein
MLGKALLGAASAAVPVSTGFGLTSGTPGLLQLTAAGNLLHTNGADFMQSTTGTSWTGIAGDPILGQVVQLMTAAQNSLRYVVVAGAGVFYSTDLQTFTLGDSFAAGRHVIWTGSLFVVVGQVGTILTSPDGITWTTRTSGTTQTLNRVGVLGSVLIAVGNTGTIVTSPDAATWTVRTSGTTQTLTDVVAKSGLAVITGGNGTILTSPDGATWTARTSGTTQYLSAVTASASTFVVTGFTGTILTSTDGFTWTARTSGTTASINSVVSHSTGFFAVASIALEAILFSADGSTWSQVFSFTSKSTNALIWDGTAVVGVGNGSPNVYRSTNGTSWTYYTLSVTNGRLIAYNGSTYVVTFGTGGTGGTSGVLTSPDLVTWTQQVANATRNAINGIIWTGSVFVRVGTFTPSVGSPSGIIVTSPNGITWTGRTSAIPSGSLAGLQGVASNGSTTVIVGNGGSVQTSSDNITWTARTSGTTLNLLGVVWSPTLSLFCAVGNSGTILTSPDGITWTTRTSGTTSALLAVTQGNGRFVTTTTPAAGSNARTLSSTDGATWGNFLSESPISVRGPGIVQWMPTVSRWVASTIRGCYTSPKYTGNLS